MKTALFFLVLLAGCAKDDSDPPDGISGMVVYHDHLTGCEYLASGHGGITPRLDANGKQVCRVKP